VSESHPHPVELAREVFRQLAQQRKPPTPENYARAYARQAGVTLAEVQPAAAAFENLARGLLAEAPGAEYAAELRKALDAEQWPLVQKILKTHLTRASAPAPVPPPAPRPGKAGTPRDATGALKELLGKTVTFLVD
jgi:translation initiation factor 2B subunit (eIF-2B alpha/beta/delta family)